MSQGIVKPGLFGLENSNRDFSQEESWGKNQFNSSFPASLACFMFSKGMDPIYIELGSNLRVAHKEIPLKQVFGLDPLIKNLHFSFESVFSPFLPYIIGTLPRIDLVTIDSSCRPVRFLRPIEIKLTALPDNQTCETHPDQYGSEIVVRPDTICYLALQISMIYSKETRTLYDFLAPVMSKPINWADEEKVAPLVPEVIKCLDQALKAKLPFQSAFMLQPVWKTKGKSLILEDNCYDIFVWSDFAFTRLFIDQARQQARDDNLTRHMRTVVWLAMELFEFTKTKKINHKRVIDNYTYNTKNDKAFACGGQVTNPYMKNPCLVKPRVKKEATKFIIRGGGERFLSPERRLDSAIMNTFPDF